jgi:3-oxoacyl-[acyl-carrier protein] reductase
MNLDLTDKVALVTGASKGIGRAIAGALLAEGMRVAVVARSRPLLEALVLPYGERGFAIEADLRGPTVPAAVVEAVGSRFSQLDLLVNNAGAT